MSARIFIIIFSITSLVYNLWLSHLANIQRKKPLPEEVSDIYEPERYQKYLSRVADSKRLSHIYMAVSLIIDILVIFSPAYKAIEIISKQNPYMCILYTYLLIWIISLVPDLLRDYYSTFKIEAKYGLNHKDLKEFIKDFVLEQILNTIVTILFLEIMCFIGEHLYIWTNNFSIGYIKSFILCAIIAIAIVIIFFGIQFLSLLILKLQYTFTPMEEGSLKDKINDLQKDSKKKVKKIYVYNESKKSPSKNAFLLKLLWIRQFGIADNFLNENSEKELLAVLSHETGHLKHKKNILNYISYSQYVIVFVVAWILISKPEIVLYINSWVRNSFDLSINNYYILFIILSDIIKPVLFVSGVFRCYRSRWEEDEADYAAVKNGYGMELINTFKVMSSDELINVNPHPVIEFLEYDHPGMYSRIKTILSEIYSD